MKDRRIFRTAKGWIPCLGLALLVSGCVTPSRKLAPEFDWALAPGNYAAHAKLGRFYGGHAQIVAAAETMLQELGHSTQKFAFQGGKGTSLLTAVWDESGVANYQLQADLKDMGKYTQAQWTTFVFRGTITPGYQGSSYRVEYWGTQRQLVSGHPDFVKENNERWNYQLYDHMRKRWNLEGTRK